MVSKLANIHEYIILCYIPNKNFDSLSGGVCVCVGGGGDRILNYNQIHVNVVLHLQLI